MEPITQKLIHSFGALADLGQEVAGTEDFTEMVRTSLHLLLGTLAIRRGVVIEYVPEETTRSLAVWGLEENYEPNFVIDDSDRKAFVAAEVLSVVLRPNVQGSRSEQEGGESGFIARYEAELSRQEIQLIVPMVVHEELTGFVMLGGKASGEPFTEEDLGVVRAMVRHVGVGIHQHRLLAEVKEQAAANRRLYEELRAIYRDTVRAFAAAIDIKDKYTQGHSDRVGKYSEIIARELGFNEEEVEGMAIAGYLHDVGKLVVERDIINAPYRIDAKQSSELNRHPAAGWEILKPINHPYADIPLMAKYHHERLDGRGYPDGLTDEQIPFGAKIVSLADSFDAMTTDRPYKTRRTFDEVVHDLRRNTGTQFDPVVVVAFCRALLKELNGETKERRFAKMLGKNYLDSERDLPLLKELLSELQPAQTAAAG